MVYEKWEIQNIAHGLNRGLSMRKDGTDVRFYSIVDCLMIYLLISKISILFSAHQPLTLRLLYRK